MKKITLSLLALSAVAFGADSAQLEADIAAASEAAKAADAKLKALVAQRPQDQSIHSNVKLGYMKTDGNSNTETFSLNAKATKNWGANSLKITLDMQYGNADTIVNNVTMNEVNKEKYFGELEYGYKFTGTLSATAVLGYKNDKFSSYNYQSYIGPGVKYQAYKSDRQDLNLEASLLYSQDEVMEKYTPTDLEDKYGSYKAKALYELKIIDDLKFNQELSYRASMDESTNYFVFSKSELSSKISDMFSAGIAYQIDYSNIVADDVEERDNTLTAFLSIDY